VTRVSWVKLDRFALFDLCREEHLTAPQFAVLYALIMLADFRTGEWSGTALELTEHVPSNRTTVIKACVGLVEAGLITYVRPFRQNSSATIKVDCYQRAVLPNASRNPSGRQREARVQREEMVETREPDAPVSVDKSTGMSQNGAIYQQLRDLGRDRGDGGERIGGPCSRCGKPSPGAPYGSNCRCPF